MPIKLNGATSGSVELGVPATVSGGDVNLTVPGAGTLDRLERAGNILQVVSRTFTFNTFSATNTTYATTPETVIDNYQTEIQPIAANSKILIYMSMQLLGYRLGPANAYASIGFYSSTTSGESLSANSYTNLMTGNSGLDNGLYSNRRSVGSGELASATGFSSTGSMSFLHTHGQSVNTYLYYTALTGTTYTNASQGYQVNPQDIFLTVNLTEVAQ